MYNFNKWNLKNALLCSVLYIWSYRVYIIILLVFFVGNKLVAYCTMITAIQPSDMCHVYGCAILGKLEISVCTVIAISKHNLNSALVTENKRGLVSPGRTNIHSHANFRHCNVEEKNARMITLSHTVC